MATENKRKKQRRNEEKNRKKENKKNNEKTLISAKRRGIVRYLTYFVVYSLL
jgi:hypothetical protein